MYVLSQLGAVCILNVQKIHVPMIVAEMIWTYWQTPDAELPVLPGSHHPCLLEHLANSSIYDAIDFYDCQWWTMNTLPSADMCLNEKTVHKCLMTCIGQMSAIQTAELRKRVVANANANAILSRSDNNVSRVSHPIYSHIPLLSCLRPIICSLVLIKRRQMTLPTFYPPAMTTMTKWVRIKD